MQSRLNKKEDTIDVEELNKELFEGVLEDRKEDLKDLFAEKLLDDFDKKIKELQDKQKEYLPEEDVVEKKGLKKLTSILEKKFEIEEYIPEEHGQLTTFDGVAGYEEIERYWVDDPYAFIVILFNKNENE